MRKVLCFLSALGLIELIGHVGISKTKRLVKGAC